jgi:hypothetical protein
MEPIIKVEGSQLTMLLNALSIVVTQNDVYSLRFAIEEGAIKIKVNEGVWSPPLGKVEK